MTDQLQLVDVAAEPRPVTLTDRQAAALRAITAAGYDGIHTDELGAHVHAWAGKHHVDTRCEWCGSTGQELGGALRRKGLAQQRRRKAPGGDTFMVWTVAGTLRPSAPPVGADDSDIPF